MKKLYVVSVLFLLINNLSAQTWTNYNTTNGLANNWVSAMAVDEKGNKWFGTNDGLSVYNDTDWKKYTTSDGLAHNFISSIVIDKQKNKWIGTAAGINKYNDTIWTTYTTADGLVDNYIVSIAIDHQGNKWFGTQSNGVSKFNGTAWVTYNSTNGLGDNYINDIAVDVQGVVWVGTRGGVSRFDGTTWKTYTTVDGLANDYVNTIVVDAKNNKWFGTYGGGISKFDNINWVTFTRSNTGYILMSDAISSSVIDADGNIWFGTTYGVAKYDGESWESYGEDDGLINKQVESVTVDAKGNKWFGTIGGVSKFRGFLKVSGENFHRLLSCNGSPLVCDTLFLSDLRTLSCIYPDTICLKVKSDTTWSVRNSSSWLALDIKKGSHNDSIHITANKNESLTSRSDTVIISHGKMSRRFVITQNAPVLAVSSNYVTIKPQIHSTAKLDITSTTSWKITHTASWLTLSKDSGRYNATIVMMPNVNPNSATRTDTLIISNGFTTKKVTVTQQSCEVIMKNIGMRLSYNSVCSIAIDGKGSKWCGSIYDGNLRRFNDETTSTYTTAEGMVYNDVMAVTIDKQGIKWIGTWGGLSKFNDTTFVNYTKANGLIDNVITSMSIDVQGNKWIGTVAGISKFDGSTWTNYTKADGLVEDSVLTVVIDLQGNKWFGTKHGISKFDGATWVNYKTANGSDIGNVSSIAIDLLGNKWFGTSHGILKFDGSTWTSYTTADGLASNSVNVLSADRKGNIWIGTSSGLSRFNGTSWFTYTYKDGLGYNYVTAITIDSQNNKWIGTDYNGVSLLTNDAFSLSEYNLYLKKEENSTASFSIYTDTTWYVTSKGNWFTLSNVSGKGDATITITAKANTAIKSRTDTISISNSFGVQNLIIKQAGGATEVSELSSDEFLFYPNPVEGKGFISLPSSMLQGRIELYSLKGELLSSQVAESNMVELDMQKYASGLYILKLSKSSKVFSIKIAKK